MKKMFLGLALAVSMGVGASEFNGYIVKFKDGSAAKSLMAEKSFGDWQELPVSYGHFAKVQGNEKSLDSLKDHPAVEYVEPNWIVSIVEAEAGEMISDPKFGDQWGLKNTGRNSGSWWSPGKKGEDINAIGAWEMTRGDREIKVAVIDTGVSYKHEDLKKNLMINEAEKDGEPGVDDDGNGYIDDVYGYDFANKDADPMDGHGHGTHCAGVIGARHDNFGIRGVMANVQILSIKFLSDSGSGETADAILAIDYATKRGVDIMSNSWGGGERSEALKEAIERANEAGIVFVAAAGNSRADNDRTASFPANYDVANVISVGAMNGKGGSAYFSNYGKSKVHVFAPGTDILSTVPGDRFQKMSGTSMATPMVSGVIGLLLASEPNILSSEVRERIIGTTVENSGLRNKAQGGRVDAKRLLNDQRN